MNLSVIPRKKYTNFYTPLEKLETLSTVLGGPNIFMKRDDLLGLTAGGNKTRKLEYLVADAQKKGADVLVTCGAVQSNHCRLTLAAAVKEKMKCVLVLEEGENKASDEPTGNYFLYQLLGATEMKFVPEGSDLMAEMQKVEKELIANGHTPYLIPVGGSNPIGATGYAACAQELLAQAYDQQIGMDYVVCTSGSGGMHAGLVAGFLGLNSDVPVIGMNISRNKEEQEEKVYNLLVEMRNHLHINQNVSHEHVQCIDDYVGPGYAVPTNEMIEAVKLVASTEGILLDPVYTGKAMAGLIDLIRKGKFNKDDNVVFVHSGGSPALYAYTSIFNEKMELIE
ncbi:D-cysteine desulfhydrase [Bacillus massiliigorillae]|uniref:D-cysteine desulfhydrase n=1 Tax=Bacillus massiliigorillae TaxID=1243664 RepID=UPI00039CB061|nr:D-cysteine desulfhydrase [Bacillus massiliigorillae]